uniref:hypothetical protein n=1 Tax=Pontiella sp. TaxID=2837462 RepID=UPI0035634DC0
MAEVDFVTAPANVYTTRGTPHSWLDGYYDVATQFGGDYDLADESDTDSDGHKAWQEYIAGTDATNPDSVLRVNSAEAVGGDWVITWQSVAGKSYSIITNASLASPNPGVEASGITGQPNETSYTGTVGGATAVFYEVGVE